MLLVFLFKYIFKNDCWYRTNSMIDIGPFSVHWLRSVDNYIQIHPWYPLSPNLIKKGEEWIPELQLNATVCFTISLRIVMRFASYTCKSTSSERTSIEMKLKTKRKYFFNKCSSKLFEGNTRILLGHCGLIQYIEIFESKWHVMKRCSLL
jgi:hypothetical protein